MVVGELTQQGFQSKSQRLAEEYQLETSKATTSALQLREAGLKSSKLSDSINRLFGKSSNPNASKVRNIARTAKLAKEPSVIPGKGKRKATEACKEALPVKKYPVEKPIIVETICLPSMTVSLPRGHYKSQLESAGCVNYLKYLKTDGEPKIKAQIIDLFPLIFKNGSEIFTFLDARSKHLEKIKNPPLPHSQWGGAAIMTLTGQGRLFILPDNDQDSQNKKVCIILLYWL